MLRLNPEQAVFVTERHLATLTTLRADCTPHVVPVRFAWDPSRGQALVLTEHDSAKAGAVRRAIAAGQAPRGALCQVEGGRWLTLEGVLSLDEAPDAVADATARQTRRCIALDPMERPVVLRLSAERTMASTNMD